MLVSTAFFFLSPFFAPSLPPFSLTFVATQLVRSWFPNQGSNLGPQQWKCKVLTTGLPGNSLKSFSLFYYPSPLMDGLSLAKAESQLALAILCSLAGPAPSRHSICVEWMSWGQNSGSYCSECCSALCLWENTLLPWTSVPPKQQDLASLRPPPSITFVMGGCGDIERTSLESDPGSTAAQPLNFCVILSKSLYLSKPQFPCGQRR